MIAAGSSSQPYLWIGAGAVLVLLGAHSWRQTAPYREIEGFYREGLRRNPDSWMMHQNLGALLVQKGQLGFGAIIACTILAGRAIADAYSRYGSPLAAFAALPEPPAVLHVYGQPADPGRQRRQHLTSCMDRVHGV